MKAIVVEGNRDYPVLAWRDVPDVAYGAEDVLLEVRATAVNRADLSQARGNYPPPPGASEILGLEASGVVREVGAKVKNWRAGDRVCCLLPGGGYAEQVATPAGMLLPLPQHLTFEQGAAIPEVWLTAFVNLFLEGNLNEGETVLIHAGGSGVGTAAIQLADLAGARVLITAGSAEKLTAGRRLGAALGVNYKECNFAEEVLANTDGAGVDVILDPVGAAHFESDLQVLRENGRLIVIGLLSGAKAAIDLGAVLGRSLHIIGSRLRPRPVEEKISITRAFSERYWSLFENGTLKPIIDSVFPLPDAQKAHDYVRQNRNIGKVILRAG